MSDLFSVIDEELEFIFTHASGPGGQNINKTESAVQLRFNLKTCSIIDTDVKDRITKLAGKKITRDGILLIEAGRFRTQEQNRTDAINRFHLLIQAALDKPKKRIPTRPTLAGVKKRVEQKKRRGDLKRSRVSTNEE